MKHAFFGLSLSKFRETNIIVTSFFLRKFTLERLLNGFSHPRAFYTPDFVLGKRESYLKMKVLFFTKNIVEKI